MRTLHKLLSLAAIGVLTVIGSLMNSVASPSTATPETGKYVLTGNCVVVTISNLRFNCMPISDPGQCPRGAVARQVITNDCLAQVDSSRPCKVEAPTRLAVVRSSQPLSLTTCMGLSDVH